MIPVCLLHRTMVVEDRWVAAVDAVLTTAAVDRVVLAGPAEDSREEEASRRIPPSVYRPTSVVWSSAKVGGLLYSLYVF